MATSCQETVMGFVLRILGASTLFLSLVGTTVCAAAALGTWLFFHTLSESVQNVWARIDAGLQRVSATTDNIQRAVSKARADVAEVDKESGDVGKSRRAPRTLRILLQQHVGPHLDELGGRLATLSDTAVAASSLLQSFQELSQGRTSRITPEQWDRWGEEAEQLSATLRRLEAAVGDGDKETDGREVASATSEVDRVLARCQEKVGAWQSDLDATREEVRQVQVKIRSWLILAGVAFTFLCLWMGMGQISLCAHALPWFKGRA
jgi:uncharacterized protein YukE